MLEALIAYHCAPALTGLKPANLVSCNKQMFPLAYGQIADLNRQLNPKDIYLQIVCECESSILLLVYRKKTT